MDLRKAIEDLTPEQRERARALKSAEELVAFAKEEGIDISDDQLEAISGGLDWLDGNCDSYDPYNS